MYGTQTAVDPQGPLTDHYAVLVVSAHGVARELRRRQPGLGAKKLHKLLYYCQGHHLAHTGMPLFRESVSAWDMGPVVGRLWFAERDLDSAPAEPATLDESQLNTIGYVLRRYGALTGQDLEHLTHGEPPWQRADQLRRPGESARIETDWMRDYFRSTDEDEDELMLDSGEVNRWLRGAADRRRDDLTPDSVASLRSRLSPSA